VVSRERCGSHVNIVQMLCLLIPPHAVALVLLFPRLPVDFAAPPPHVFALHLHIFAPVLPFPRPPFDFAVRPLYVFARPLHAFTRPLHIFARPLHVFARPPHVFALHLQVFTLLLPAYLLLEAAAQDTRNLILVLMAFCRCGFCY
jgi:hypothetical protein